MIMNDCLFLHYDKKIVFLSFLITETNSKGLDLNLIKQNINTLQLHEYMYSP